MKNQTEKKEAVFLNIGGRKLFGWERVRITRGIERFPCDFDLQLMDYSPATDEKQWVKAGEACEVRIENDPVITGYMDNWNPVINKTQHLIRVSGRGKRQDLVDCVAQWENNVIHQANALQIAEKLAKSYGITVSTDVDRHHLDMIPQFTLNWGESSQQILDRICRWSALLYYEREDGNLFLTLAGDEVAASGVAQGVNIEEADYRESMAERYSDYIGVSLSVTPLSGGYEFVQNAQAKDREAKQMRYRNYLSVIDSNLMSARREQEAIDWEMNRRYGRAKSLRVVVDSWRDSAGKLWQPNTLIPIHLPIFGLSDKQWLLSEVVFIRDLSGTRAILTLITSEGFVVEPYEFYQTLRV
uniref:Phage tail protein n=1 Tax=Arsenophonus endosymbiont of Trialeurodes vaporariorum TaxID=235567 RepID=A0A3B0M1E8_9GAMM